MEWGSYRSLAAVIVKRSGTPEATGRCPLWVVPHTHRMSVLLSSADMLTGKANPVLSGLPRLLMSLFTRRPFPRPALKRARVVTTKATFAVGTGEYGRIFSVANFRRAVEPVLTACGDHW